MKYIVCVLLMLMAAHADGKVPVRHKKKKAVANIKLIEAYTQRTLPGMQTSSPPPTANHFIIVWQGASYPETFFWRGDGGWLSCAVSKAHKPGNKDAHNRAPGTEYTTETIMNGDIRKGDTLELNPVTRGKYAIPADIPKLAKNTLYYKTGGSGWLSFPIKTIIAKKDISMP